jgi:glycosyltransferase 2 family protein
MPPTGMQPMDPRPSLPNATEEAPPPGEPDRTDPPRGIAATIARSVVGLALGLGVATAAGYGMGIRLQDVAHYLTGFAPWGAAVCVAGSFGILALQSLRWHGVLRPLLGVSYLRALRVQIVSFMFNAILPARGGDLLRVQYFGRLTGKSRAAILGTEIVDRWLDWTGWIPTFLFFCAVGSPPAWLIKALMFFGCLLLLWGIVMVCLIRIDYRPRGDTRWARIYGALKSGVNALRSPRIWLIALLVAPLPWIWESMAIAFAAGAFGIHLDLLMAFSVLMSFNVAMVIPSPGAIGTIEAGGTAALVFFGVDQSRALAFMCIYHLSQLLPGILAGATILVWERHDSIGRRLFTKGDKVALPES